MGAEGGAGIYTAIMNKLARSRRLSLVVYPKYSLTRTHSKLKHMYFITASDRRQVFAQLST